MSRTRFVVIVMVLTALMLGTINSALAQGNVLVVWADDTRAPIIQGLADQVEADLGIELDVQELGLGAIRDQLTVAGPVGEGPDVLVGVHDWLGNLVTNGAVLPLELSDELTAQFLPVALDAMTYNDGNLYGIPYAIENIALIRNVDLVPEAPTTWDEVRAVSQEIQDSGAAQYGFLTTSGNMYVSLPIITSFGGYIFGTDENGNYDASDLGWNSEGSIAAAEWMSGMYTDGLMVPNIGDDELFQLFEDGELGMFITGPWFSQRIIDTGINYAIDPFPDGGQPFYGVQAFMISAFSENQLLAEIFLTEYVASDDFMQQLFEVDPRGATWLNVDESVDPNVLAFRAAGENAIAMPSIPEMGAIWAAANNSLTLIAQGDDPVESMNNGASQIMDAIGLMGSDERHATLVGSLQAAAGCPGDWDPLCETTEMTQGDDGLFTFTVTLPAGEYEYKVAINFGWDENYGVDGESGGANIALSLSEETEVTFTYDDETNIISDSVNN